MEIVLTVNWFWLDSHLYNANSTDPRAKEPFPSSDIVFKFIIQSSVALIIQIFLLLYSSYSRIHYNILAIVKGRVSLTSFSVHFSLVFRKVTDLFILLISHLCTSMKAFISCKSPLLEFMWSLMCSLI